MSFNEKKYEIDKRVVQEKGAIVGIGEPRLVQQNVRIWKRAFFLPLASALLTATGCCAYAYHIWKSRGPDFVYQVPAQEKEDTDPDLQVPFYRCDMTASQGLIQYSNENKKINAGLRSCYKVDINEEQGNNGLIIVAILRIII